MFVVKLLIMFIVIVLPLWRNMDLYIISHVTDYKPYNISSTGVFLAKEKDMRDFTKLFTIENKNNTHKL